MSATVAPPIVASASQPLGAAVPPFTEHAISISLPTWRDNVGYEEGEKRVVDAMVTGYPRFFIHRTVQKLAAICEQKFGQGSEKCLLCPSRKVAEHCRAFILDRLAKEGKKGHVRLVQYFVSSSPPSSPTVLKHARTGSNSVNASPSNNSVSRSAEIHIVLFPSDVFPYAKQFWQHSGMIVSSRLAEHCLALLASSEPASQAAPASPIPPALSSPRTAFRGPNRHYSVKTVPKLSSTSSSSSPASPTAVQPSPFSSAHTAGTEAESLSRDQSAYIEERYGRNLPLSSAAHAKRALRRRIAGVLLHDDDSRSVASDADADSIGAAGAEEPEAPLGPSSRGVPDVTEHDVFLFPTGMAAIWSAHQLALGAAPPDVRASAKSVCFGFPYTDTLKILEKWGPGCHFFGHGLDADIDELERILAASSSSSSSPSSNTDEPRPILALFTEFPSNPLLRSPSLPRLRALADKHNFLLVVDDTIGNFLNVTVLPYADIVVTSLSKIFSGDANAMGGALVLNPARKHYHALKRTMTGGGEGKGGGQYEDVYWAEDALFMERNSRDFARRVRRVDANTLAVCEFLHSRSLASTSTSASSPTSTTTEKKPAIINEVFYPKYTTPQHYAACRVPEGGYGGLFSLTFTSPLASRAFFDALPCMKGPSLGTNFTLASPYVILAHYTELPWAAEYGVEEGLVRVSVGLEERETLLSWFGSALSAAERAVESESG